MQIQGNTFLVSGGSSGLGAACVRMLVEAGASVVVADLNQEKGQALINELGDQVHYVLTDVTDEPNIREAIRQGEEIFGPLRGSIQCAGIGLAERVLGKTGPHALEAFQKVIAINLVGTFNVNRLAAEAIGRTEPLASGERGVLINTASVAAFEGQIGQAAYAASKGGVVSLTLPLARELARFGIRVMTIAPGIFDTPLLAGLPDAARASLGQQVPFPPRLGKPEEYAQLARQIIENEMLNGAVIRLDGALRMAPK
jgi:NAD(P)-dependent dehydrogenase (short-subunit alcohol dehydrogenase family)